MKFPSIEQFRHVYKKVESTARFLGLSAEGQPIYDENRVLPVLDLTGTVKLHGTNAGVELKGGKITVSSRTRVIVPEDDNAGFAKFVQEQEDAFMHLFNDLGECVIFGEWVGAGINAGCAIHEIDRAFFIFAIRRGDEWLPIRELAHIAVPDSSIFNIASFQTFAVTVDFNNPQKAAEMLGELTQAVEDQCPVGEFFGKSGVGEGIVWTFDDPKFSSSGFWFKTKGEKHKVTSTKKLVEVDVEKQESVSAFVDAVLTEARLEQGLAQLPELDQKYIGDYLRWVVTDVLKEESDRMIASELEKSDITKATSNRARVWLFAKLNEF